MDGLSFDERFEQWVARREAGESLPARDFFDDPGEAREAEQLLRDEANLRRVLGPDTVAFAEPSPLISGRFHCDWKKLLGRGGQGEVFEGEDTELGRTVAIKRPRTDRMSDELKARLVREARVIGRLEHPGLIPVYGGR